MFDSDQRCAFPILFTTPLMLRQLHIFTQFQSVSTDTQSLVIKFCKGGLCTRHTLSLHSSRHLDCTFCTPGLQRLTRSFSIHAFPASQRMLQHEVSEQRAKKKICGLISKHPFANRSQLNDLNEEELLNEEKRKIKQNRMTLGAHGRERIPRHWEKNGQNERIGQQGEKN